MYGWRAKIGLITPMSENAEHAFHIYAPEGVSFASMKINFPGPTPEGLIILTDQLAETAAKFKGYPDLDLVVFGCTSGSCIKGIGWDKECCELIEKASGFPGLTTSTAVLEALHAVETKKVAVLTPYPEATNIIEKKFLEDNGFEVTNIVGMDMSVVGTNFFETGQRIFPVPECDENCAEWRRYVLPELHGPDDLGNSGEDRNGFGRAGDYQPSSNSVECTAPLPHSGKNPPSRETIYDLKDSRRNQYGFQRTYDYYGQNKAVLSFYQNTPL